MSDRQVAYTAPGSHYPAYFNARREGGDVIITVRGEANGDAEGPIASIRMTSEEFDNLAFGQCFDF